jgi:cell division control protein 45
MHLHRAILRTGTSLLEKRHIRHLHAFRMTVVKEGPDVSLFTHPAALTKLALWLGEAISEQEKEQHGKLSGRHGRGVPLVVAGLNEKRDVYVIVGTGGGGPMGKIVDEEKRKEKEEKKKARDKKRAAKRVAKEEQKRIRRELRDDSEASSGEEDETEDEPSSDESDSSDDEADNEQSKVKGAGRNRFGLAFAEVVAETGARVRMDSFENCVVEVNKEDLAAFLEALSMKTVVG